MFVFPWSSYSRIDWNQQGIVFAKTCTPWPLWVSSSIGILTDWSSQCSSWLIFLGIDVATPSKSPNFYFLNLIGQSVVDFPRKLKLISLLTELIFHFLLHPFQIGHFFIKFIFERMHLIMTLLFVIILSSYSIKLWVNLAEIAALRVLLKEGRVSWQAHSKSDNKIKEMQY